MFPETGKATRGKNNVEKVDVRDCTQPHLNYPTTATARGFLKEVVPDATWPPASAVSWSVQNAQKHLSTQYIEDAQYVIKTLKNLKASNFCPLQTAAQCNCTLLHPNPQPSAQ